MDEPSRQFVIFSLFGAAALALGYVCGRRGWVRDETSRPIHHFTVLAIWPVAHFFGVWQLEPQWENLWLLVFQPLLVLGPALAVVPLGRWAGLPRSQVGVVAVSAGLGNLGFTLGAYLCYSVLEPGEAALGYALAQVMVMAGTGILCLYPLARHFGPAEHRGPVGRLIVSSLFDSRSLALWAAGAGLLAAVLRWPFPEALFERWSVMDVLFYAGTGLSHFGIGLRLELAEPWRDWRAHGLVALAKFGLIPVLSGLFLVGLTWAGWPLSGLLAEVVWLQAFMPTAILSVMIANLFHLDGRLASSIWFWNTLGFLVFVAPVLLLLGR